MRFRQQLNELIYAIPSKHSKPVSGRRRREKRCNKNVRHEPQRRHRTISCSKSTRYTGQGPEPCIANGATYQKQAKSTETSHNTGNAQTERRRKKIWIDNHFPNGRAKLVCSKCLQNGHSTESCYFRNLRFTHHGKVPPRMTQTIGEPGRNISRINCTTNEILLPIIL